MRKSSPAIILFLMTSITFACIASIQVPTKPVAATGSPSPIVGRSFTWRVLETNGKVWWWDNSYNDLGNHTLTSGGTIQYNLTGQYPNDASWSSIPGNVWYGNFSIFHNASTTQIWNWTRTNCSTTEVGSNLDLSVYAWQGGLIAPINWTKNFAEIDSQPHERLIRWLDGVGLAVIDYLYNGQTTHLEYNSSSGVLTYARTSFFGFSLEISLSGFSKEPPFAKIGYNQSAHLIGTPVQFWDESYSGSRPFKLNWAFGDGSPNSTATNPAHVYSTPGNYTVTLFITDNLSISWKIWVSVYQGNLPTAPQNLNATGGNKRIILSWQFPASDGGFLIGYYNIYRGMSPGSETYLYSINHYYMSWTITDLTGGQRYYFKITAVNAIGTSLNSSEVSAMAFSEPSTPRNLSATASNGRIVLSWNVPLHNGGSPITGYTVYRGVKSFDLTLYATVSNVTTFTDTNATNGQTYFYTVCAVNSIGTSLNSTEVFGTPSAPTPTTPPVSIPGYQIDIVGGIMAILSIAIPVFARKKFNH